MPVTQQFDPCGSVSDIKNKNRIWRPILHLSGPLHDRKRGNMLSGYPGCPVRYDVRVPGYSVASPNPTSRICRVPVRGGYRGYPFVVGIYPAGGTPTSLINTLLPCLPFPSCICQPRFPSYSCYPIPSPFPWMPPIQRMRETSYVCTLLKFASCLCHLTINRSAASRTPAVPHTRLLCCR